MYIVQVQVYLYQPAPDPDLLLALGLDSRGWLSQKMGRGAGQ